MTTFDHLVFGLGHALCGLGIFWDARNHRRAFVDSGRAEDRVPALVWAVLAIVLPPFALFAYFLTRESKRAGDSDNDVTVLRLLFETVVVLALSGAAFTAWLVLPDGHCDEPRVTASLVAKVQMRLGDPTVRLQSRPVDRPPTEWTEARDRCRVSVTTARSAVQVDYRAVHLGHGSYEVRIESIRQR